MTNPKSRKSLVRDTNNLPGVTLNNYFWPEIVWQPSEISYKNATVVLWGTSRDAYHKKRGWNS